MALIASEVLFVGVVEEVEGLNGAWEAVFSPDGAHVYVTGADSDSVLAFDVDPDTGMLTVVPGSGSSAVLQQAGVPAGAFDGVAELALSSDGTKMFTVAAGNASMTSLRVDVESGNLTYADTVDVGALAGASDVVVDPLDGNYVYVPSVSCSCIMVFAVDVDSFGLTYMSNFTSSLISPRGAKLSADGGTLYVTDSELDGILLLSRDSATGTLSLLQVITSGSDLST